MAEAPSPSYQIKVTLLGTKPPVWRRLAVSSELTLGDLHWVIQESMPWTNSHLHHFIDRDETYYSDPGFRLDDTEDEAKVGLGEVMKGPKDRLLYEYDFGDGWEHAIELEKVLPATEAPPGAACVAGKRACPPDDCGGVWGYEDMLHALRDRDHDGHDDAGEFLGEDFDPGAFDSDAVNRRLAKLFKPRAGRRKK